MWRGSFVPIDFGREEGLGLVRNHHDMDGLQRHSPLDPGACFALEAVRCASSGHGAVQRASSLMETRGNETQPR